MTGAASNPALRPVTAQVRDRLQLETQAAAMFRGHSTAQAMAAGWRCRLALERGASPAQAMDEARS